ncbi:SprT-like domain-containing protein [Psychrobacter sp. AOP31-A1-22]|uniref:SprT-like domain-containing protein n=1 Tax=Psychrobacter sp. AOP31-A1-22 TaxID=3457696 RepID=UPI004036A147
MTTNPAEKPTIEFYGYLDKAFDFFNERLFDGELPSVMFELTNKKRVGGYFKSNAWQSVDDTFVHTIAINPQYIVHSTPLQVLTVLAHEMCHQFQYIYGNVGRRNYHNSEWADKMESIGLMPSSTGKPGGKRTGQSMSDYPIPGGSFESTCVDFFLEGNFISFVDASVDEAEVLKFRNNLMQECVNRGQSLAEHFNSFQHSPASQHQFADEPVTHVSVDDYLDDLAEERGTEPVEAEPKSSEEGDWIRDLAIGSGVDDANNNDDDGDGELIPIPHFVELVEDEEDMMDRMSAQMALLVTKPTEDTVSLSVKVPEEETAKKDKKKKVTYQCLGCSCKVWGKPGLSILCVDCEIPYEPT